MVLYLSAGNNQQFLRYKTKYKLDINSHLGNFCYSSKLLDNIEQSCCCSFSNPIICQVQRCWRSQHHSNVGGGNDKVPKTCHQLQVYNPSTRRPVINNVTYLGLKTEANKMAKKISQNRADVQKKKNCTNFGQNMLLMTF